jgi:hypothetical protein
MLDEATPSMLAAADTSKVHALKRKVPSFLTRLVTLEYTVSGLGL